MTRLFHVSDHAGIPRFEPRRIGGAEPSVWAIDGAHLCNYLVPRQCPRVCFRGPPEHALLAGAAAVVAIEAAWEERLRTGTVAIYELPADGFVLTDPIAGYWQSAAAVTPLALRMATDLPRSQPTVHSCWCCPRSGTWRTGCRPPASTSR